MTPLAFNPAQFIAAQKQLREAAGTDCVFSTPGEPVWPGGTKINDDTGLPYDATVVPTNEPTLATITVLIVEKQASPLRPGADPYNSAAGMMQNMDVILDVDPADYTAHVVDANEFLLNTLHYRVIEAKPFSISNTIYRWLVYGQEL